MKVKDLYEGTIKLDMMSGEDTSRALEIAHKEGIEVLEQGTGTIPMELAVDRNSLQGAIFLSYLRHEGIEFDDVSE